MFFSHRRKCCCSTGVPCEEGGSLMFVQCYEPCNRGFRRCVQTEIDWENFECGDIICSYQDGTPSSSCTLCLGLPVVAPCNICEGEDENWYEVYKCVKCYYVETTNGPDPVLTGDVVCATANYGITSGTTFGYGYWDPEWGSGGSWVVDFSSATGGYGILDGTAPCPEEYPGTNASGTFYYAEYCGCDCGPGSICGE